jgi:hypothetical protein
LVQLEEQQVEQLALAPTDVRKLGEARQLEHLLRDEICLLAIEPAPVAGTRQTGSQPLGREPSPDSIGSGAALAEHGTRGEFAADRRRHTRQTAFGRRRVRQMLAII